MQVERGQARLPGFEVEEVGESFVTAVVFESCGDIYRRVFRALRPRTPVPEVSIEYCRFAGANSFVRWHNSRLELRITDVLEGAPAPIQEALAYILLSKLLRRPVPPVYRHRYRLYLNRQDMRRSLHLLRQARGRKHISGPEGERFNLKELFAELNARFFHGLLAEPELGWSRTASRTLLGHFDPAHNAIILSKLLDSAPATRLAVEYVLYHEMLHLRYPVETAGAKRRVHTKEFKAAEKLFPGLKEAKAQLESLCTAARRR
ncbi:MAG: SprT family zinc-dependent metalloprotease [Acidobacteria bacterium]|nr:SprT family zinc-dependent metalloprotease [Acidobacteriota bacterium]